MNNFDLYPLAPARFNSEQRKALDKIGRAFKHHRIDFKVAKALGEMVKDGRVAEALEQLGH